MDLKADRILFEKLLIARDWNSETGTERIPLTRLLIERDWVINPVNIDVLDEKPVNDSVCCKDLENTAIVVAKSALNAMEEEINLLKTNPVRFDVENDND
jgi:hypothetical protein